MIETVVRFDLGPAKASICFGLQPTLTAKQNGIIRPVMRDGQEAVVDLPCSLLVRPPEATYIEVAVAEEALGDSPEWQPVADGDSSGIHLFVMNPNQLPEMRIALSCRGRHGNGYGQGECLIVLAFPRPITYRQKVVDSVEARGGRPGSLAFFSLPADARVADRRDTGTYPVVLDGNKFTSSKRGPTFLAKG